MANVISRVQSLDAINFKPAKGLDELTKEIELLKVNGTGSGASDGSSIPDNTISASKLKTSSDADKIKLINLSTEVQQAMTGTTPISVSSTPSDNSVTTKKLAPELYDMANITKVSAVADSGSVANVIPLWIVYDVQDVNTTGGTIDLNFTFYTEDANITSLETRIFTTDNESIITGGGSTFQNNLTTISNGVKKNISANSIGVPSPAPKKYIHLILWVYATDKLKNSTYFTENLTLKLNGVIRQAKTYKFYSATGTVENNYLYPKQILNFNSFTTLVKPIVDSSVKNITYSGKIINFLGDSITARTGTTKAYWDYLCEKYGMVGRNYGMASTMLGGTSEFSMLTRHASMDNNTDGVIVYGGTNDYKGNLTLGVMADRTNTTFYGSLHLLMDALQTKYPTKGIGFITPFNYTREANGLGKYLIDYVKAIIEVGEYYGIPVFNNYANSGLNSNNLTQMPLLAPDTIHPNELGHKIMAKRMENFILSLLPNDVVTTPSTPIVIPSDPADTTAPNNVTNLMATPSQTSVVLNWSASTSSDISSYDVYRGSTLLGNVTGTTYTATSLTAGTSYTFTVKSKDANNNVSTGVSVTTSTTTASSSSTYYLQMDGVDDYLKLPSMTMDSIEVDALVENTNGIFLDARTGLTNGYVFGSGGMGAGWAEKKINGAVSTANFTVNQRFVVKVTTSSSFTDDVNIFSQYTNGSLAKGNLYKVTCYLSGAIVAQYDMSTGNVQDISGNGKHATLTGGTWITV